MATYSHAQTDYIPVPGTGIDNQIYQFAQLNEGEYGKAYGSDQHPSGYALNINLNDVANSPGSITQTSQSGCDELYKLSYKIYDIDYDGEVRVYINNVFLAEILATGEKLIRARKIEFCGSMLSQGNNLIEFRVQNSERNWGVTDILLKYKILNSVTLNFNSNPSAAYGNNFGTNQHPNHLVVNFNETEGRPYVISASGWDIDQTNEVSVYFNDNFIGFLNTASGCNQCPSDVNFFSLVQTLIRPGRNQLVFIQRLVNQQWGVSNLTLRLQTDSTPLLNLLL